MVNYNEGLDLFFENVYADCFVDMQVISITGNNKSRMLGKCREGAKLLKAFNQRYAALQYFELDIN